LITDGARQVFLMQTGRSTAPTHVVPFGEPRALCGANPHQVVGYGWMGGGKLAEVVANRARLGHMCRACSRRGRHGTGMV
jgi:hypothetical protein